METREISEHLVRFYLTAKTRKTWATSGELATEARIAPRTGRAFSLRFVREGIFDQAALFPGHRYRLSAMADKRNKTYLQRLEQAAMIFSNCTGPGL
jgi:hypothetical protein